MKCLSLFFLLSIFKPGSAFSQTNFSFAQLQQMDKLPPKSLEKVLLKKGFKLDKTHQDSLLGDSYSFENRKTDQYVVCMKSRWVNNFALSSNSLDTLSYVSAAKAQGYRFQFSSVDQTGSSSFYFKGQSVLTIRHLTVTNNKVEQRKWMVLVQNTQ